MNKKLLLTLGSVALIGAIGIGSTFAYLTASTGEVTNKFEIGYIGLDGTITLDEAKVGVDGLALTGDDAARVNANDYTNLFPGQVVDKDPTVHVTTDTTLDAYIFVEVDNADFVDGADGADGTLVQKSGNAVLLTTDAIDKDVWTYLGTNGNGNAVFYTVHEATAAEDYTLFTKVTVNTALTNGQEFEKIVVDAAAVQYAMFEDSAENAFAQTDLYVDADAE